MNYKAHYNTLIEYRMTHLVEGYSEQHHIVPRCLGGSDNADNLVRLTAEEHYVAHQLLVKIYPGHRGLIYAARMMTIDSNGGRVNNKLYGWLKKQNSIARTGFKHTAEARAKIAKSRIGFKHTAEARAKISAAQLGTTHSVETKAKMSASAMGVPKSDAARKAMSIAKKGKPSWKKGMTGFKSTPGSFKKGNTPWNIGTPAYERAVEIDGITYRSRTIAAKHLSKDITTIMRWLKNGKAIDKGIA